METKINIGPVHPATHGVLRLVVTLDGDTIKRVEPYIGYLHRGVEKLVETRMFMQSPSYMEKLDYVAPMSYDELYVSTIEAAMGIEVKERAKYLRMILLELQRIASHLLWLATTANDVGQWFTIYMWAFADRDRVLKLLEEATGARMFYVNMRLGGLNRDVPEQFGENAIKLMEYLDKRLPDYESFLEGNPVFLERMRGVGILKKSDAVKYGATGPVLRGSGIDYDARSNHSYYLYKELNFYASFETKGDCLARYKVRIKEIKTSINLVMSAVNKMPKGDALGMPIKLINPEPKNKEVLVRRELPRGESLMYLVADKQRPYRLGIRSPTFVNLSLTQHLPIGARIADLFPILASLDPVMGDSDR